MTDQRFERLNIFGWRQFGELEIDLTDRLTVLTGANGAGKTTLLNVLGRHFSWQSLFLGTPDWDRSGQLKYYSGTRRGGSDSVWPGQERVGALGYSDGQETPILVPTNNHTAIQYETYLPNQQAVQGLFLASHRSVSGYQAVTSIPPTFTPGSTILEQYLQELRNRYSNGYSGKSASLIMKESLLAAAIYGEGNSSVSPNPEAQEVWAGFQEVLADLLPKSLGFIRLQARPPEIILMTKSGTFAIDAVSGGVSAIMELAWQVFLRSRQHSAFTVCFDEPENHLHPQLQRSLFPALLNAFPRVSFVVATHSPFIVTSVQGARTYALDYDAKHRVRAKPLDFDRKVSSAEETLRDVLGVPTTIPIWAEREFNAIMSDFVTIKPTREALRELTSRMNSAGLGEELPYAIERFLSGQSDEGPAT